MTGQSTKRKEDELWRTSLLKITMLHVHMKMYANMLMENKEIRRGGKQFNDGLTW